MCSATSKSSSTPRPASRHGPPAQPTTPPATATAGRSDSPCAVPARQRPDGRRSLPRETSTTRTFQRRLLDSAEARSSGLWREHVPSARLIAGLEGNVGHRMIQVGTGGFGATWCQQFLPPSVQEGRIEVVAAVDVNPAALENAQRYLGLPLERCYTDIHQAFDENPAEFCTIVVPPAGHEQVVDLALEHDLDILSEKPIADSLEASVRIADKVKRA